MKVGERRVCWFFPLWPTKFHGRWVWLQDVWWIEECHEVWVEEGDPADLYFRYYCGLELQWEFVELLK